jgi:hypothetical protein
MVFHSHFTKKRNKDSTLGHAKVKQQANERRVSPTVQWQRQQNQVRSNYLLKAEGLSQHDIAHL